MKAYKAIGTHHFSTNFNVDGRMVTVDFNPIACIDNEQLQQSIEKDTSYGILFESCIEPVEEVTTTDEDTSTTGDDVPLLTLPVIPSTTDITTTDEPDTTGADAPPAADVIIPPVVPPVTENITSDEINAAPSANSAAAVPSNTSAEDNKAAAIHGTVTTENMGSINANSVTKKTSNKRNSKKQ